MNQMDRQNISMLLERLYHYNIGMSNWYHLDCDYGDSLNLFLSFHIISLLLLLLLLCAVNIINVLFR